MNKEQLRQLKNESKPREANDAEIKKREGIIVKINSCIKKIKEMPKKKILVISGILLAVLAIGTALKLIFFKTAEKKIYEVAIMVRSQNNPDEAEDRRTSLKAGDVLVTQKDGHKWSKTESVSYLILKMNLSEEQAQKLTRPEEREIDFDELSKEEQGRIEEEKKRAKEEDREYVPEPRTETLRAREYRIDLARDEFEGFTANELLNGQPYLDQVFDWRIVERKKSVLKEK